MIAASLILPLNLVVNIGATPPLWYNSYRGDSMTTETVKRFIADSLKDQNINYCLGMLDTAYLLGAIELEEKITLTKEIEGRQV